MKSSKEDFINKPSFNYEISGVMISRSEIIGGGERDRTDDLLLAKQALSQLSYTPDKWWVWMDLNHRPHAYQACALTS